MKVLDVEVFLQDGDDGSIQAKSDWRVDVDASMEEVIMAFTSLHACLAQAMADAVQKKLAVGTRPVIRE